ncbi:MULTISPECIES: NAD-binding protein [unclassified Streptomyces]|uniref:NAD-binding protein n=1 Tax=unclassified Streptomyces TaxID=2593676 RepID=UPI0037F56E4A
MKALIAGAGRLGNQVAQVLSSARNDVTFVEHDEGRIAEIGDLPAVHLVAGNACDPVLLERAGALTCDLVIAATGRDEDNLVISLLAERPVRRGARGRACQ